MTCQIIQVQKELSVTVHYHPYAEPIGITWSSSRQTSTFYLSIDDVRKLVEALTDAQDRLQPVDLPKAVEPEPPPSIDATPVPELAGIADPKYDDMPF